MCSSVTLTEWMTYFYFLILFMHLVGMKSIWIHITGSLFCMVTFVECILLIVYNSVCGLHCLNKVSFTYICLRHCLAGFPFFNLKGPWAPILLITHFCVTYFFNNRKLDVPQCLWKWDWLICMWMNSIPHYHLQGLTPKTHTGNKVQVWLGNVLILKCSQNWNQNVSSCQQISLYFSVLALH